MIYESFSEAQQLTVVESAHTRVNIYNSLATGITEMTFASADESKLQWVPKPAGMSYQHAWSLQSAIDSTHAMSKPFASNVIETLQMEQVRI